MAQPQLLHERDGRLEMLMPGDVGQGVVESADGALEEDHAEGCFQDGGVIRVPAEGGTQL